MVFIIKKVKMYGLKMGSNVLYKGVPHRVVGFCLDNVDYPIILNGFEQDPNVFKVENTEDNYILENNIAKQFSTYASVDELQKIKKVVK